MKLRILFWIYREKGAGKKDHFWSAFFSLSFFFFLFSHMKNKLDELNKRLLQAKESTEGKELTEKRTR